VWCVLTETDDEVHSWVMVGTSLVGTVDDFGTSVLPDGADGGVPDEEG
jgi:hypothetical protein